MTDESPIFCENKYVIKNTKPKEVSLKTLLKYAYKLNEIVKDAISDELPEIFGLMFGGWSMAGEHYIAIFATWVNSKGNAVKRLLSCGVQALPDEDLGEAATDFGFSADDIGDYVFEVGAEHPCHRDEFDQELLKIDDLLRPGWAKLHMP